MWKKQPRKRVGEKVARDLAGGAEVDEGLLLERILTEALDSISEIGQIGKTNKKKEMESRRCVCGCDSVAGAVHGSEKSATTAVFGVGRCRAVLNPSRACNRNIV
jgi:hypothetical protein